jgi:hypothetical protein
MAYHSSLKTSISKILPQACQKGCREKISTRARFSPLAFGDNLGKNVPKYKKVTRSTDSSRMSYLFFIIALTAVLAVAL